MPYIPPEVVEQAKQIDLLSYLQAFEPGELVRISSNNYTTRTHDSLKISNGKWMWWSHRIGGYNALDYLIKVKEYSFVKAVETLIGKAAVMSSIAITKPKKMCRRSCFFPKEALPQIKLAQSQILCDFCFLTYSARLISMSFKKKYSSSGQP